MIERFLFNRIHGHGNRLAVKDGEECAALINTYITDTGVTLSNETVMTTEATPDFVALFIIKHGFLHEESLPKEKLKINQISIA